MRICSFRIQRMRTRANSPSSQQSNVHTRVVVECVGTLNLIIMRIRIACEKRINFIQSFSNAAHCVHSVMNRQRKNTVDYACCLFVSLAHSDWHTIAFADKHTNTHSFKSMSRNKFVYIILVSINSRASHLTQRRLFHLTLFVCVCVEEIGYNLCSVCRALA